MLPGQGLLPSSICHLSVTPVPASMRSKPLNEEDAIVEAEDKLSKVGQAKAGTGPSPAQQTNLSGDIFVIQGFYANPGVQQSRSARFGPGVRSEEAALGIVLAWMEFQHTQATARRSKEFLSRNERLFYLSSLADGWLLPQPTVNFQHVCQQCDQLRNDSDESEQEELWEADKPCLDDGHADQNQQKTKKRKQMSATANDSAIPPERKRRAALPKEMDEKKGDTKDTESVKKDKKDKKKQKRQKR